MVMIQPTSEYHVALAAFITQLTNDLKRSHAEKGYKWDIIAFVETGRKFDKILIKDGESTSVRYFIKRDDGTIYGAKSTFAANLRWYFGTIYTAPLWGWGDWHGHPINDPSVRAVGGYAPYIHYMRI